MTLASLLIHVLDKVLPWLWGRRKWKELAGWLHHDPAEQLTEALRQLSGPGSIPLTGEHCGQGQLVPLQAGISHARAPHEVRSYHLPVGDELRWLAHDGCRGWVGGKKRRLSSGAATAKPAQSPVLRPLAALYLLEAWPCRKTQKGPILHLLVFLHLTMSSLKYTPYSSLDIALSIFEG